MDIKVFGKTGKDSTTVIDETSKEFWEWHDHLSGPDRKRVQVSGSLSYIPVLNEWCYSITAFVPIA